MIKVSEKSMQAVVIDRFGGPETIRFDSVPVPKVGPDEVLIHIESAGVGVWDPFEREGGFARMFGREPEFPYVLGTEGAGTVAAVGRRVRRFKPGDRVYAAFLSNPKGGFYAEYTAMPADNVSPIPQKLTTEQAGVMLVDAITALRGLDDAINLKPGESVMIFGIAAGSGTWPYNLRSGCRPSPGGGVRGGRRGARSAVGRRCYRQRAQTTWRPPRRVRSWRSRRRAGDRGR